MVAALESLKREGTLEARGERMPSRIAETHAPQKTGLRIRLLPYEESDAHSEHILQLAFRLKERGHHVAHAAQTLTALKFAARR